MIYVSNLNSENFDKTISDNSIVIVDVFAEWCGPCKQLSPIIDQVASEFGEKVLVGKLDADANMETVKSLGVRNIPTVLIYKDGAIVEKFVGVKTKNEIVEMVTNHF